MKKVLSTLIIGVLATSFCCGCNEEPEPLEATTYETIAVKSSNSAAQSNAEDTAVRYFYLINNGAFAEANKLIDRTDLSICTPEILKEMYGQVENFDLGDYNRVVGVSTDEDTVSITFINTNDTSESFDTSYDEENTPPWLGMTTPYIPDISYASTYEIEDVNDDGVIDETDMTWEDHPELNPDYEGEEDTEGIVGDGDGDDDVVLEGDTTSTGAAVSSAYRGIISGTVAVGIDNIIADQVSNTSTSETSKVDSDTSKSDTSKAETSKSDVSTPSTDGEVSETVSDVAELPEDLYSSQSIEGYKTYQMDITVKDNDGVFFVQLPDSMTTPTRLMIKVPEDMYIKVGDLELDKSIMNLDDFYVINKLPKVAKFDIFIENLISGSSQKTIDLTERVYYIYSNIVPSRVMKDEVLAYSKTALQSLYSSMLKGEDFAASDFYTNYVSKNGNVSSINTYYDKYVINGVNRAGSSYKVISTEFPTDSDDDDYEYSQFTKDSFRITSYYYVDVPVVVTVRVDTKDSDYNQEGVTTRKITGILKLTKDNGEWYVWDVDSNLMLDDGSIDYYDY